eukprot:CAMPEP_0194219106 /NCGR_PEP_ID=MMETSP0156-20130528/25207_1 /TAXON_ID=33649 /ORGANISM="Thalassionema nitzschioides, Strain L26-B" /LENGTH=507 /DNA_ID=CAMNT_0038948661 /DNA_START=25 /DNA_END=1548 /DNA_ORIENTATION=+
MIRRRKNPKSNNSSSNDNRKKPKKTIDLGYYDEEDDESIDSDLEEEGNIHDGDDDSSSEEETAEVKKVRLAKAYLKKLEAADKESSSEEEEEEDDDHDRISNRLQRERLKREGTLERMVAKSVANDVGAMYQSSTTEGDSYARYFKGHDLTVTCVALQQSTGERALSGSKDGSVIVWDIENQARIEYLIKQPQKKDRNNGNKILSLAMSDDGHYAAVGKQDASVTIYDVRASNTKATTFQGHKGPVTCLAFRMQSHQLFSGSDDRCIRHYSLDDMAYMETLYGHQAGVADIDCYRKERPISVGRDRTARAWKLAEDTHLIFRGGSQVSSADRISVIKDDWFVSGHDDGSLHLWLTDKKKAVASLTQTHGSCSTVGRGITALACLKGSDLVVSGSYDSRLRLWEARTGLTMHDRGIEPIGEIPVPGYINDIAVGPRAKFCVVAVGQEPSLGRWNRVAKAKNRFGIVQLRKHDGTGNSSDVDEGMEVNESGGGSENAQDSDSSNEDSDE